MIIRNFETGKGIKGFIQKEGVFNIKWVIYEKRWIGDEKIGEIQPKEEELRKFLENKYGKPVKIWGWIYKVRCFLTLF